MIKPDTGAKPKIRKYSWVLGSVLAIFIVIAGIFLIAVNNDSSGQAAATSLVFGSLAVTVAIQWRNEHQSYHQHQELKDLVTGAQGQQGEQAPTRLG